MKKNGFTVTELIVSTGILAVVILTIFSLFVMAQGGINEIRASNALSENLKDVRVSLTDERSCTLNLVDTPLSMASPAGAAVAQIRTFDKDGVQQAVLYETGKKESGVKFEGMILKPNTQVDLSHITADLEVRYKKNVHSGEIAAVRHISILAQVQFGRIQKCWLQRDLNKIARTTLCMALSEGAFNEYSEVDNSCIATNAKYFPGSDAHSATCPAGTALPSGARGSTNCQVVEPPGFIDPVTTDDGAQPYISTLNKAAKKCSCAYDVLIPAATIATFKCQIYCVVL